MTRNEVIMILGDRKMTAREVAKHCNQTQHHASLRLRQLYKEGYLVREPGPYNVGFSYSVAPGVFVKPLVKEQIINLISEYEYITTEHLAELLGKDNDVMSSHLSNLAALGAVERVTSWRIKR